MMVSVANADAEALTGQSWCAIDNGVVAPKSVFNSSTALTSLTTAGVITISGSQAITFATSPGQIDNTGWQIERQGEFVSCTWDSFTGASPSLSGLDEGDWVIIESAGTPGTGKTTFAYSLAEALGRNFVGIDIQKEIVDYVKEKIDVDGKKFSELIVGDSTKIKTFDKVSEVLQKHKRKSVQLAILHPPYADIVKFSDKPDDLSNSTSLKDFLEKFARVLQNTLQILDKNRYIVIVIGDKYTKGQWIPLGFYCMNEAQKLAY
jgi:SAM-dependent methyltransferase